MLSIPNIAMIVNVLSQDQLTHYLPTIPIACTVIPMHSHATSYPHSLDLMSSPCHLMLPAIPIRSISCHPHAISCYQLSPFARSHVIPMPSHATSYPHSLDLMSSPCHLMLPAIPIRSISCHPHAISCYQLSPFTRSHVILMPSHATSYPHSLDLMSSPCNLMLPAISPFARSHVIPMPSHATSYIPIHSISCHPHAISCYQLSPFTRYHVILMQSHATSYPHALSCHYQPSPCTLMSLPAIPMHSHVTTSHPRALSCHYQPSPCTLMSLPAIPMHSHVTTSHPRALSCHYHALSCHYQPSPCTLMSLPAIPVHSHVTTSHPHTLSCHYQPSPCTLMSLPAIPVHSHVTTMHSHVTTSHPHALSCHYQPCIHVTHTLSCMHVQIDMGLISI